MSRRHMIEWAVLCALALVWAWFAGRECGRDVDGCFTVIRERERGR